MSNVCTITLDEVIAACRRLNIRVTQETADGFTGDRNVTVSFNNYCHSGSVIHSLANALFDAGIKLTIYGDIKIHKTDDSYDATINFSVDKDSIYVESKNESGSDSNAS